MNRLKHPLLLNAGSQSAASKLQRQVAAPSAWDTALSVLESQRSLSHAQEVRNHTAEISYSHGDYEIGQESDIEDSEDGQALLPSASNSAISVQGPV